MIERGWTYEEVVANIETLRNYYVVLLTSFSYFERKKRIKVCRDFKEQIYSLQFDEYKRNMIWKYINDEIEYEELIERDKNNGFDNKRNDKKIQH